MGAIRWVGGGGAVSRCLEAPLVFHHPGFVKRDHSSPLSTGLSLRGH